MKRPVSSLGGLPSLPVKYDKFGRPKNLPVFTLRCAKHDTGLMGFKEDCKGGFRIDFIGERARGGTADAQDLKSCSLRRVWVRVPPRPLEKAYKP